MIINKLKDLFRPAYKRVRYILKRKTHYEQEALGVSNYEIDRLLHTSGKFDSSVLFGKRIKTANNFWYLHSLKELFIDEVYRFRTDNSRPFIIDCGANIGLSIIYFKRLFPDAKIIAFEPDNDNYEIIKYNLSQFGYNDVEVKKEAVWKETTVLQFSATGHVGGKLDLTASPSASKNIINTNAVRLKDYLNQKIDFLKIDIEGAEYEVMNDCADMLFNVENLFVEYHSEAGTSQQIDKLLKILNDAGFKVYIQEAWKNLPYPFLRKDYDPYFDMQLNIFAYRD